MVVAAHAAPAQMPIIDYIRQTWSVLTRSNQNLATAAADPKFSALPDGRWPVYAGRDEDISQLEVDLRAQMRPQDFGKNRSPAIASRLDNKYTAGPALFAVAIRRSRRPF